MHNLNEIYDKCIKDNIGDISKEPKEIQMAAKMHPIKDNYITKDDVDEIEQIYGNVNTPPEDEDDIVAYASGTNTKNFGTIGVGQAHGANVGIGAVGYRTIMLFFVFLYYMQGSIPVCMRVHVCFL